MPTIVIADALTSIDSAVAFALAAMPQADPDDSCRPHLEGYRAIALVPAFAALPWVSLRLNWNTSDLFAPAAKFIKAYRNKKTDATLWLVANENAPVAVIDWDDLIETVVEFLVLADTSPHNEAQYAVNGPDDITEEKIPNVVKFLMTESVKTVQYRDARSNSWPRTGASCRPSGTGNALRPRRTRTCGK